MFEHGELCDVCRLPVDGNVFGLDPVEEVIVLPTPSVEEVGESVDLLEKVGTHGGHATEVFTILQTVLPLVHGHADVFRPSACRVYVNQAFFTRLQ